MYIIFLEVLPVHTVSKCVRILSSAAFVSDHQPASSCSHAFSALTSCLAVTSSDSSFVLVTSTSVRFLLPYGVAWPLTDNEDPLRDGVGGVYTSPTLRGEKETETVEKGRGVMR